MSIKIMAFFFRYMTEFNIEKKALLYYCERDLSCRCVCYKNVKNIFSIDERMREMYYV